VKYQVSRVVAGPFLRLLGRPEITGEEHIPRAGGAIVASNHLSMVDSLYLPFMLERPLTFAAKSEYFSGGMRPSQLFAAAYMRATKQLSVDRDSARSAQDTLQAALELLQAGELFGVYPEGTRSPDGRLYRGRTGVGKVVIRVGEPMTFDAYRELRPPAKARRAIADDVMRAIQALSGQEYVHMYASDRKAELNGGRGRTT
jgi:1-acyl-sn-glycerol-3-phosphate acyltransferase